MILRWIAIVCGVALWDCGVTCRAAERPAYVIEAPDILTIEARGLPKGTQNLKPDSYLVRPDGTVSLGVWGSVPVTGLTVTQAQAAILKHLTPYVKKKRALQVRVDVFDYNSKRYYLIRPGQNGEDVTSLPYMGNETVLDAISQIKGLEAIAAKGRVEVFRDDKTLVVNWRAITRKGRMTTNYEIQPGDRIRVTGKPAK